MVATVERSTNGKNGSHPEQAPSFPRVNDINPELLPKLNPDQAKFFSAVLSGQTADSLIGREALAENVVPKPYWGQRNARINNGQISVNRALAASPYDGSMYIQIHKTGARGEEPHYEVVLIPADVLFPRKNGATPPPVTVLLPQVSATTLHEQDIEKSRERLKALDEHNQQLLAQDRKNVFNPDVIYAYPSTTKILQLPIVTASTQGINDSQQKLEDHWLSLPEGKEDNHPVGEFREVDTDFPSLPKSLRRKIPQAVTLEGLLDSKKQEEERTRQIDEWVIAQGTITTPLLPSNEGIKASQATLNEHWFSLPEGKDNPYNFDPFVHPSVLQTPGKRTDIPLNRHKNDAVVLQEAADFMIARRAPQPEPPPQAKDESKTLFRGVAIGDLPHGGIFQTLFKDGIQTTPARLLRALQERNIPVGDRGYREVIDLWNTTLQPGGQTLEIVTIKKGGAEFIRLGPYTPPTPDTPPALTNPIPKETGKTENGTHSDSPPTQETGEADNGEFSFGDLTILTNVLERRNNRRIALPRDIVRVVIPDTILQGLQGTAANLLTDENFDDMQIAERPHEYFARRHALLTRMSRMIETGNFPNILRQLVGSAADKDTTVSPMLAKIIPHLRDSSLHDVAKAELGQEIHEPIPATAQAQEAMTALAKDSKQLDWLDLDALQDAVATSIKLFDTHHIVDGTNYAEFRNNDHFGKLGADIEKTAKAVGATNTAEGGKSASYSRVDFIAMLLYHRNRDTFQKLTPEQRTEVKKLISEIHQDDVDRKFQESRRNR